MSKVDYKRVFAIKQLNEKRIKELCPSIERKCGIYVFTRFDENGFKFAYAGQAVNLLERCASHLSGYQHIDLSIKKHGLYNAVNCPYGWKLQVKEVNIMELNTVEQAIIKKLADDGFQLRNETTGSQGEGKKVIRDYGQSGYRKGKADGYDKALKEVAVLIEKYTTGLTSKGGKTADRKTSELLEMLKAVSNDS